MAIVTYGNETFECVRALKSTDASTGVNYVDLVDSSGKVIHSFVGVDFEAFTISEGSWSSCASVDNSNLIIRNDAGRLQHSNLKPNDMPSNFGDLAKHSVTIEFKAIRKGVSESVDGYTYTFHREVGALGTFYFVEYPFDAQAYPPDIWVAKSTDTRYKVTDLKFLKRYTNAYTNVLCFEVPFDVTSDDDLTFYIYW